MDSLKTYASWLACLALGVLLAVGCASNRGSSGCGGGCGGGCCRGKIADDSTPSAVPVASAGDVTYLRQPENPPRSPATAATPAPYGGQKTCPVTGEELGSMGAPVPVTVNGQTIYVCCQGCAGKLRKNPDAYLAKVKRECQGN